MLKLVHDAAADAVDDPETMTVGLDELCRVAAQEMLTVALLAERRAYLDAHADVMDEGGRRMVVGNGYARERSVMTGAGMVDVKAPRVEDQREGEKFSSGRRWRDSSVPRRGCRPPRSAGSPRRGRPSSRSGRPGTCPTRL
jgi:putative transposase